MTVPVLALDLSLAATGVCLPDGTCRTIHTPKTLPLHERIAITRDRIACRVIAHKPALVVIEAVFANPKMLGTVIKLAKLHGAIRDRLIELDMPVVEITPAGLKHWATGTGNADKDRMVATAIRHGATVDNDNEADAYLLWGIAQARYDTPNGWPALGSLIDLPWPELKRAA